MKFGRYQVADPPSALLSAHLADSTTPLQKVDWEPKVAVLDQEDLIKQGIDTSKLIPGAQKVDALGSCTANAFTAHASSILSEEAWTKYTGTSSYINTVTAEKAAITFYHECTDQTGDPSQEWPPTDCGSSGPYVFSEAKRLGYVKSQQIAHGAQAVASLLQTGSVLLGTPFLNAWMNPGHGGVIDGNGSVSTLQAQIDEGVAGGHEIVITAIEKLVLLHSGLVDATQTIIRFRNSWTKSWADGGSGYARLSTFATYLGSQVDFRQFAA